MIIAGCEMTSKGSSVSERQCRSMLFTIMVVASLLVAGCGGEPPLHSLTGKVTLGGKSYSRLLVYFRPLEGKITPLNLGVGETDQAGVLSLRSTAGMGLIAGKYRVSFSCMQPKGRAIVASSDEKPDDDRTVQMIEMVPEPYDNENNADSSPLEFEIKAGAENHFEFDIPVKS